MGWKWLTKHRADGTVEQRKVEVSDDHEDDAPPPVAFHATAPVHNSRTEPPVESDEVKQLRADNARQKTEIAAAKAETYKTRAEAAYNALATAKKAIPAEKAKMVANMIRDQADDDTNPIPDAKRFDARVAEYEERMPHNLDASMIDGQGHAPSDEEIRRAGGKPAAGDNRPVTAATPVGQTPTPDRMEYLAGLLSNAGGTNVKGQFKNLN